MRPIYLISFLFIFGFSLHIYSQIDHEKEFMKSNNFTEEEMKYVKRPRFPGGKDARADFFKKTLKRPQSVAGDNRIGEVITEFTVEKDGTITNPFIRWGSIPEFDKEVLRTILMMPKWEPGEIKGEKAVMKTFHIMNFTITNADFDTYNLKLPQFISEEYNNDMDRYISANIDYPQDALDESKQGIVYVQLNVDKKGKLKNVRLLTTSRTKSLDEEALRIIKNMPDWQPGEIDGKVSTVRCVIPVEFKIK